MLHPRYYQNCNILQSNNANEITLLMGFKRHVCEREMIVSLAKNCWFIKCDGFYSYRAIRYPGMDGDNGKVNYIKFIIIIPREEFALKMQKDFAAFNLKFLRTPSLATRLFFNVVDCRPFLSSYISLFHPPTLLLSPYLTEALFLARESTLITSFIYVPLRKLGKFARQRFSIPPCRVLRIKGLTGINPLYGGTSLSKSSEVHTLWPLSLLRCSWQKYPSSIESLKRNHFYLSPVCLFLCELQSA